jgi:hypothetical protein
MAECVCPLYGCNIVLQCYWDPGAMVQCYNFLAFCVICVLETTKEHGEHNFGWKPERHM